MLWLFMNNLELQEGKEWLSSQITEMLLGCSTILCLLEASGRPIDSEQVRGHVCPQDRT